MKSTGAKLNNKTGKAKAVRLVMFLLLASFALMMPAMVYYINEIMSQGEAVKGQALFTMMLTFSTIAASFAGGWILDAYGASSLTFISTIVTAAGAVIVILFIGKVKSHREQPDGF